MLSCIRLFGGCSPSDQLGGVELINVLPDTRIISTPPQLSETGIKVKFSWMGDDPDGRVIGYLWKISSNNSDGISVQDTLTEDPASGDIINPWHFTTATDSIFMVTADSAGYIGDINLPEEMHRFHQAHTFFIKAVDDDYQVDPTPALSTFTATTIAPSIQVTTPTKLAVDYREAQSVPPTFTIGWTGQDIDFELKVPTKVRYLLKRIPSDLPPITDREAYLEYKDQLISFSDPAWSDWISYKWYRSEREAVFHLEPDESALRSYYLFAIQAQDTAGAVSLDLSYARTVHIIYVDDSKTPVMTLEESFLGDCTFSGEKGYMYFDIAQGQQLSFSWQASAEGYGGEISGYRFGWDVDSNDPNDPNWGITLGNTPSHRRTTAVWDSGLHTLYVECYDTSNQRTLIRWDLSVVPIPQGTSRSPILLIDDVVDQNSLRWPSAATGGKPLYQDKYRDAFWLNVLDGPGGVKDFKHGAHIIDTQDSDQLGYRQAVAFDLLLWTINRSDNYMFNAFNLGSGVGFSWLETYLREVGNLFLAGTGAMRTFHTSSNWIYPVVYDNTEGWVTCSDGDYRQSFGFSTNSETGAITVIGRTKFPYRVMGVSMTDLISPPRFLGNWKTCAFGFDRSIQCTGTKAILLDQEFKDKYVNAGDIPDTLFIEPVIDWRDAREDIPDLRTKYHFGAEDEFYNHNISGRTSNWAPLFADDGSPIIEPMFHVYARYDWWLDKALATGSPVFPDLTFCGTETFNKETGRTIVDGAPVGVISHRMGVTGIPNVLWGFDPYRMEHEKMTKTVRWVLKNHFGVELE